jgi:phosphoribosylformylglycinamidine synthase II
MRCKSLKIIGLADEEVEAALRSAGLGLAVSEARSIAEVLGRDPSIPELFNYDTMWSEHCSYKSSRATLNEFLHTTGPNVVQGPEEDAGIVAIDDEWCVVIAHESHNHPSQILPNEGAATGIGGIVRDVNCMGAKVVATGDPLRFGDPNGEDRNHVRWVAEGVVDGIWQYGNALGVPVIAGDVVFDDSFDTNCLVNVVAVGVVKRGDIIKSRAPAGAGEKGYDVILIGKPTDSSGFGGVTFASEELREEDEEANRGAIQIPDPFLKNVLFKANEALFQLTREEGITIGFKDLGGGGFTCASSEMGASAGYGMDLDLDKLHKASEDLPPEVVACAETQERFMLICPPELTPRVLEIYNEDWDLPNVYEGARASVVGKVTTNGRYITRYRGEVTCDISIEHLTKGIHYQREERPRKISLTEPVITPPEDLTDALLKVLASPNVSSREHIYRYYDTEVQGNSVIRPGEADAGLIAPVRGEKFGIALSVDANPFYGRISPYWAGATAVAEAMRNVAAIGAYPATLTDCLNFGNPEKPEAFWEFRECVKGLADAAKSLWLKGYEDTPVPIVSGNVSFYNESPDGTVDPSPVIACVGLIDDVRNAVTMNLKMANDSIYLIGPRFDELGGSEYYRTIYGVIGKNVPVVRFELERNMIYAVIDSIAEKIVVSAHDISNGGLGATAAEMALAGKGDLGIELALDSAGSDLAADRLVFSESSGFLLECRAGAEKELETLLKGRNLAIMRLGKVTGSPELVMTHEGKTVVRMDLKAAKKAWTGSLAEAMR